MWTRTLNNPYVRKFTLEEKTSLIKKKGNFNVDDLLEKSQDEKIINLTNNMLHSINFRKFQGIDAHDVGSLKGQAENLYDYIKDEKSKGNDYESVTLREFSKIDPLYHTLLRGALKNYFGLLKESNKHRKYKLAA